MSYTLWVITGKMLYLFIKQLHTSICQHIDRPGIGPELQLCARWITTLGMAWLIVQTVNLSSIIYRLPSLKMSGAMYFLPLYAFMVCTWQHYVFFEKRVVWHWQLWWIVTVLGYCYIVTFCIFEGYIERKWEIFFRCPHRTAVVMFVLTKKKKKL